MFIVGAISYNIGGSKKLADIMTRTGIESVEAGKSFDWGRYHQEWRQSISSKIGLSQDNLIVGAIATCAIPFGLIGKGFSSVGSKIKECWRDAKDYAHQERIKGSALPFLLNAALKFLYFMLPIAVLINATNNGLLYTNSKRNDMLEDNHNASLSKGQKVQLGLLTGSLLERSGTFGAISVCEESKKDAQKAQEQAVLGVVRFSGALPRTYVHADAQRARARA